ncbi:Response regulator MprA [compost metagenome]
MYKARILYLEDDLDLGETTFDLLGREGYFVEWSKNGNSGLQSLENNCFDIVVADIMMPQLDGYSFLKTIREGGNQIPFIYLSARVLTEDILKGFQIGADDYIRKPFSLKELIARIDRLIKNISKAKNDRKELSVGRYRYDPMTYQLNYLDNKTILSPRLGEILRCFLENKDGVLNRKEILLHLWGDDNFFNGRSLDVFISKLRKKLCEDQNVKITNIRGVGYRLIVMNEF